MNNENLSVLNARKIYYSLLAKFLVFSVRDDRFFGVLETLNIIKDYAIDDESHEAINDLIKNFSQNQLSDEYDEVFHAPPKPLHNTFSFYDEGYSAGSALVKIRQILAKTSIRKNEIDFKENEDNIGFVFALMSDFISKILAGDESYKERENELFVQIINPFIDEFLDRLYAHEGANLYKNVCVITRNFMEFERVYFGVSKPLYQREKNLKTTGISRSEAIRREGNKKRKFKDLNTKER
ncbi:TorD/DmsD family molecular chaperone [Campylobacter gastrosuis]|uniref:Molecular chaperone TorD family protein n=1 Tax=Campylobacter gastrosuis TaxID=2974576 RepID=A0ABT7HNT2_9BACT|nr:molecular chaperone TorD family protein [Campylobacter gastrosuis]MDL0088536.1 molecular chaperone TorD family protein [Campylobacter gastrosuis]